MSPGTTKRPQSLEERVTELSHQVIETRNQMIKTSNLLGNLSSEIKEISRQHQNQKRGLTLNSVAAYVIFVVLISGVVFFAYRSQKERLDFEKGVLMREQAAAKNRLVSLRKTVERRRETEEKAAAFYRLSQSGKVHQALHKYPEIAQLPLSSVESAVFQDWAHRSRNRLAYSSYSAGMKAVGEKHWKRAVNEFRRSLTYLPHPPHEASLRYYHGISQMKLGNYPSAATELEAALAANAEKYVNRQIRYYMGMIYEQMGQFKKAKNSYKQYIKRNPSTPHARVARRRLKKLD